MPVTKSIAAFAADKPLGPYDLSRRDITVYDVGIDIMWAGICHSDLHTVKCEWGPCNFPCVPGHEIIGKVSSVGTKVTKFSVGEVVGVGVIVDSCRTCKHCKKGRTQYCQGGPGKQGTYGSKIKYKHHPEYSDDPSKPAYTQGGYSQYIVTGEDFVVKIPTNLDLPAAAPLLCAGITVWSPLIDNGVQPRQKVGVAGLGGLGHMAVKFAVAMGCHVTVISTSDGKKEEALKRLGAHAFINSKVPEEMKAAASSLDFVIDTIAAEHDLNSFLELLDGDGGKLCLVGLPVEKFKLSAFSFVGQGRQIVGSCIGSTDELQDMLNFCGLHNITCEVEKIKASQVNEAYERLVKNDVKYRFVIDVSTM